MGFTSRGVLLGLLVGATCLQAAQQDGVKEGAEERVVVDTILVTARHQEEDPREVPFSLTILDADTLDRRRVDDPLTLFRQAPGLSLTSFDDGRFAYFQLRGIGPLSQAIGPDDGSVVTYVDGVPQPVFASEFAYLDLERVEVLRGPQGTLFGRNSQGGVINITTRRPSGVSKVGARLEVGELGFGLGGFSLSGPLGGERLRGGLFARASTVDGFIDNTAPGGDDLGDRTVTAARGVLTAEPREPGGLRIDLAANADRRVSNPFYYVLRGRPDNVVEVDPENEVERTTWGLSARLDKPLGSLGLTSITAANGFETDQLLDDTNGLIYGPLFGLPAASFLPPQDFSDWREQEARLFQEFRLASSGDSETAWTAGVVYFRSELDVELDNRSTFSPILNGDRDAEQVIESYAAYGEVTTQLFSPRLRGTAGLRYTRDEKSLDATFAGVGFPGSVGSFEEQSDADFDFVTGRVALLFQATDQVNLYTTVGRGAKSGGFPRLTLNAAFGVESPPYAESTSWSYEAGAKTRLLGGRSSFDVSGFYNDVDDEQLFVLDLVAFQFVPVNLDTRSFGVEAQYELALSRRWSLATGLAWTDSEMRQADAFSASSPGNPVPNVPALSTTASVDYRGDRVTWLGRGFTPFLNLTHQYVDERSADVADSFELDSYQDVSLRAGAAFGRVEIFAFARNLLDEDQEINGVLFGPGLEASSLAQPRVLGVGLTFKSGQ